MTHTRHWSNAHLKSGCWCPVEEEDTKKACLQADSKGAAPSADQVEEQEDEVEVDINKLPTRERNKILAKKKRDDEKALKDAEKTKEKDKKAGKRGEKSGKPNPSTPPLLLAEASTATPSQNARKRDASVAKLSMSRLQQVASPALMDYGGGALRFPELFICTSLLSIDAHFVEHNAFHKEWLDMKAFLEKVFLSSCYLNASC